MIIPYPYDRTGAGAAVPSGGAVLGERGVFTWLRDGKLHQRSMEIDGVFLNSAKVRSMAVLSDGTARNTTVHTGGTQTILDGGVAEGVTVTVGRLGFILFGTLWVSWTWVIISFPILGKFSTIISSSIFSLSFFLSSSSETPMIRMLGHLTLSQRSLRLSSFLLILFSFFLSASFISIFYLTYPIFCLLYSTVGSLQSDFDLIYCIIHYILTLFYFF